MKKINKESEDIDLFVNPRQITKEEQTIISDYIKLDKQKRVAFLILKIPLGIYLLCSFL